MRLIMVGLGRVSNVWIQTIQAMPTLDLVALVEINAATAEARSAQHGLDDVPRYTSLGDALAAVEADGLIDLTPPHLRLPNARAAFDAGLPVLAEKPLSDTMDSAQALVELVEARQMVYIVAQNYRYSGLMQTAKQMLARGDIGTIGAISVQFYRGIELPGFHASLSDVLLQDMSIHHFDLMRFFLDADPTSIFARSYNAPYSWHKGNAMVSVSLAFEFETGTIVTYDGSWAATGRETTWNGNWRFDGEKGVLRIEDDDLMLDRTQGMDAHGFLKPTTSERLAITGPARNQRDGLLRDFQAAVTAGQTPDTSAQDNIRSLRMVYDAITSARSGQPVVRQRGVLA